MRDRAESESSQELVFLVWECQNLGRSLDKHIDNTELTSLVPSASEVGRELHRLSPEAVREAEEHVRFCVDCSSKVSKYRQLVNRSSNGVASRAATSATDCPEDGDVNWHEVAAGLWPELKTRQLMMHAALCDHCGPLLRSAASIADRLTPQEEKLLAKLELAARRDRVSRLKWSLPPYRPLLKWLVPAVAVMVVAGILSTKPPSSTTSLSGPRFAEFAVSTHWQHAQGNLALDVRLDSQQMLNDWFKSKLPFVLSLPASPAAPGEDRPYRLEGARLVPVGGKTAAFIAYQMQTGPVSLVVTPDSVAVASGGVKADFSKVSFHYAMVGGYKVVTWSAHGLTYALVSQEGHSTQGSCMVCHSSMRDRDLSKTPTPLPAQENTLQLVLQ